MTSSESIYDILLISKRANGNDFKLRQSDIFLLAYLACLLSIYNKRPVSEWGYKFVGISTGAPFSSELCEAVDELINLGILEVVNEFLKINERGIEWLNSLEELSQYSERKLCLEGACSTLLALPFNIVGNALKEEPALQKAIEFRNKKILLEDGPELTEIYNQFDVLGRGIGFEQNDLMIPATVWLSVLFKRSEKKTEKLLGLA